MVRMGFILLLVACDGGASKGLRGSTSGEWPNPLYVRAGASGMGTEDDPMGDLGRAVAEGVEFGEVRVFPGTYQGPFTIGHALRLTGLPEDGQRPILTAPPGSALVVQAAGDFELSVSELVIDAGGATGIDLRGPHATLRSVEVQGGGHGVYVQGGRLDADQLHLRGAERFALLAQGSAVRLVDLQVDGQDRGPGVRLEECTATLLGGEIAHTLGFGLASLSSHTEITALGISKVTTANVDLDGDALLAGPLSGGEGGSLHLLGVDVREAERAGVIVFGTTAGDLSNSTFAHHGRGGVWLQGTAPARLEGNRLEGNGLLNAYAGPGSVTTLVDNLLLDPVPEHPFGRPPEVLASYGLVADGATLELLGNSLVGASEAGVLAAETEGTLADTLISDCPTGLLLQASPALVAEGTRFVEVAEPQRVLAGVELPAPLRLEVTGVDPVTAPQPDL